MSLESRFIKEIKKIFNCSSISIHKGQNLYEVVYRGIDDMWYTYYLYDLDFFDNIEQAAIKIVDDIKNNRYTRIWG